MPSINKSKKRGGQVAPDSYCTEEHNGSYVYKRCKLDDVGRSKKSRGTQ